PRQGTAAAALGDTVPAPVKAQRRERLRQIDRELAEEYQRRLLGRVLDVLVEGGDEQRPGHARGTSCRYAPVVFSGDVPALRRQRIPVRAVRVEDGVLVGEPEQVPHEAPSAPLRRLTLPLLA